MLNGTQQKLGYREVIFNINNKGFYAPLPGDNYETLPIQSGEGGEVSTFGTGDINLETPTVTALTTLPDTSGLQTQQDFNIWAVSALESLASSVGGSGFSGDYNDLINQPSIPTDNAELANGANYITLGEVPAGFSGDYNDLTNQPTIPTDNADLANGAGYITLSEVPEPDLEGSLIFRGTVVNEAALPADAVVGDLYYNEDDGHLYAQGSSTWHKLNTIDDVDLGAYAKLTDSTQSITANEFIGDGSKLTNLPSGGGSISEVLAEGNTADPGQSLHFRVNQGDLPPFTRDIIDVEAGTGLRLGGLVSYYTINEAFTIDTDHGATDFTLCQRRMSAVDDYYFAHTPGGDFIAAGMGVSGISFSAENSHLELSPSVVNLRVGDFDDPLLRIEARTDIGTSSITAGEFIGDGSKLTNLPAAAAPINEVLAAGNETDFGQHIRFKSTADSIPPTFRESLLPDGTEIDFSGGSGNYVGPLVSYHLISEPFHAEAGGVGLDIDFASARTTAVDTYYSARSGDEVYDASVGLTGILYRGGDTSLSINHRQVNIIGNKDDDTGNHGLDIFCDDFKGPSIKCQGPITANKVILHRDSSDLPYITKGSIDIESGAGHRLGGTISTFVINEPFTIDSATGATDFQYAYSYSSALETHFYTDKNGSDVFATIGLEGLRYKDGDTSINCNSSGYSITKGDHFNISANSSQSSITATEFIGDGSKLTLTSPNGTVFNLSVADDGTLSTTPA